MRVFIVAVLIVTCIFTCGCTDRLVIYPYLAPDGYAPEDCTEYTKYEYEPLELMKPRLLAPYRLYESFYFRLWLEYDGVVEVSCEDVYLAIQGADTVICYDIWLNGGGQLEFKPRGAGAMILPDGSFNFDLVEAGYESYITLKAYPHDSRSDSPDVTAVLKLTKLRDPTREDNMAMSAYFTIELISYE